MDISIILMGVGILCIIISFFLKDKTIKLEKEIEDLSINIYQETNSMKRRLKIVEEELLLDHNFQVKPSTNVVASKPTQQQPIQTGQKQDPMTTFKQVAAQVQAQQATQQQKSAYMPPTSPPQATTKPVHSILVNQVLELNKQGLAIDEICRLSTLSQDQVRTILANNGGV